MSARVDAAVTLRDGRRLAYTEWGPPDGSPVLYFHGTPASRIWCPDEQATTDAGVRLILPDRPGIGRSDPKPQRTLADWTSDVLELADALRLSTFAVVGVSAGGPYAAACAALIPSRLTAVAIVSSASVARYNWEERPGIEATWPEDYRAEFELVRKDPVAGAELGARGFAPFVEEFERDPTGFHKSLEADAWFFTDPGRVAAFDAHTREAWRQGLAALAWELNAVYMPWGFKLADISMPVRIWHGLQDSRVTDRDVDFEVRTIPIASLTTWPDSGHLGFVKHWGEILEAVAGPAAARPDRAGG